MTSFEKLVQVAQLFMVFVGLCWGIFEFGVKEHLRKEEPSAIALTAKLEELDRQDCMVLLRAHLDVTNRGNGKAWVPSPLVERLWSKLARRRKYCS